MRMKCYSLLIALLVLGVGAYAEASVDKSKVIRKSFPITEKTTIEVSSKYGKVDVQTWDKDSVSFKIKVTAKSRNEDESQEMIDDTEIRFNANDAFVVASTYFEDEGTQLVNVFNRAIRPFANAQTELDVDYLIMVPAANSVQITNKFGDVFIGNREGNVKATVSYGKIRLGNLSGYTDLNLKFGDLNAQEVKRLNLDVEYSDVVAYKVENADVNSKSCKVNFHEVVRLRSRTKRDDYTLYKAGSVNADGEYSDFVITELEGSLNFTGKLGNITIHNVKPSFTRINMNCTHSNANLSFDENCQFTLDLNLEEGDFAYPMNMLSLTEKQDEGQDISTYFGYVGTNPTPDSIVEIFGESTDVNITLK